MPVVDIKGVGKAQFPDEMPVNDIKTFLRNKYFQDVAQGNSRALDPQPQTAANVNPSLIETAGQKVSDYLFDQGIISDRYRAQEVGKNIAGLGEFLPVIGDATAGDDFGKAIKKGNYGEAALAGVSTIPVIGDMAIFAGALAKNADLGALRKAKDLELQGKSRDQIWSDTGWFNDKGDWKFEISDALDFDTGKGADINPSSFNIIKEYGGTTKENFIGHPELYEAYPSLKDRPVKGAEGSGGSYNYSTDTTRIGENLLSPNSAGALDEAQSVGLHEIQHAIQNREGFAKGGSPEQFVSRYNTAPERIKDANYSAEIKGLLDEGVSEGELLDLYKGMPEEQFVKDLWDKQKDFIKGESIDYFNRLAKTAKSDLMTPDDQYQRLAGEAEARLVQKRMNMTPDERRARPPWQDLDVPEDELIYRGGNSGTSLSANNTNNSVDD